MKLSALREQFQGARRFAPVDYPWPPVDWKTGNWVGQPFNEKWVDPNRIGLYYRRGQLVRCPTNNQYMFVYEAKRNFPTTAQPSDNPALVLDPTMASLSLVAREYHDGHGVIVMLFVPSGVEVTDDMITDIERYLSANEHWRP